MQFLKRLVFAAMRRAIRLLPTAIKRDFAEQYIAKRISETGMSLALYDGSTDLLRFSEPHTIIGCLAGGSIADAVPWLQKIAPRLPQGGVIFDVGGYHGITAQWFARMAKHVHTFEPTPESVESIRRLLKVRQIANVSLHPIALSNKVGTSDFYIFRTRGHNSLGKVRASSKFVRKIQVPTTTLDTFVEQHGIKNIDFLKIDTEGFELEVLQGAKQLLSEGRIGTVIFEYNAPILSSIGQKIAPLYELLMSAKYAIADLEGRPVSPREIEQAVIGDFIASRN